LCHTEIPSTGWIAGRGRDFDFAGEACFGDPLAEDGALHHGDKIPDSKFSGVFIGRCAWSPGGENSEPASILWIVENRRGSPEC
jgi:hypothetical protein